MSHRDRRWLVSLGEASHDKHGAPRLAAHAEVYIDRKTDGHGQMMGEQAYCMHGDWSIMV